MTPSRETLQRLQRELDFSMEALETVMRLGGILADLRSDPLLRDRLILKGGTALNLCFGAPRRLSVDLDFNDIGAPEREQCERDRPLVVEALERLARRAGYLPQRSRPAHAGQKFFLRYESPLGGQRRIEVDLNFLHRVALEPVERRAVWSPIEGEAVECAVMSTPELLAGKLLALLDRAAPRDLFDVAHFVDSDLRVLGARPRLLFVALSAVLPRSLADYGQERLDRVTDAMVMQSLHPLLRTTERPGAAELRERAWEVVEPWLTLSEAEREYAAAVQQGDVRPELLLPDDAELVERIRRHPAIRWKAENARRWGERS